MDMMSKPSYEGLIHLLIRSSEKAAGVARVCRRDPHLFELLVQEKPNSPRFVRDFKTLADVLIQESVRADVAKYFPNLTNSVFGEEDSHFVNAHGELIRVEVGPNIEDTANLLAKVLDGDRVAANSLAAEVHSTSNRFPTPGGPNVQEAIQAEACLRGLPLGIWIDPIDSTAEYISGGGMGGITGLTSSGLACVTVLIGVYRRDNGKPVFGVVNQPFFALQADGQWIGQIFYGFCLDDMSLTSLSFTTPRTKIVVVSGAESPLLRERLQAAGYLCIETAGAGYKLLAVAIGLCDAYLLSRPTTFAWDTCAPHALLASVGGRLLAYRPLALDGELQELSYERQGHPPCNTFGLVAVRDASILGDLAEVLQGLEEDQ